MTLLLAESFGGVRDANSAACRGWTTTATSYPTGGRRATGFHVRMANGSGTSHLKRGVPAMTTPGSIYVGFAWSYGVMGGGNVRTLFRAGSTSNGEYVHLKLQNDGLGLEITTVEATGSPTTLIPGLVLANNGTSWYYVEIKLTYIAADSFSVSVRVDGIEYLTNYTFDPSVSQPLESVTICGSVGNGLSSYLDFLFTDLYIADSTGSTNNTFLGPLRVEYLLPTADGAFSEWTPSAAGAHFGLVNDTPDAGDTDYIATDIPTQRDTFAMSDLADTAGTVKAVVVTAIAKKNTSAPRTVALTTRSGGQSNTSANKVVTQDLYRAVQHSFDTDPATSAAWTTAAVNALEAGVVCA